MLLVLLVLLVLLPSSACRRSSRATSLCEPSDTSTTPTTSPTPLVVDAEPASGADDSNAGPLLCGLLLAEVAPAAEGCTTGRPFVDKRSATSMTNALGELYLKCGGQAGERTGKLSMAHQAQQATQSSLSWLILALPCPSSLYLLQQRVSDLCLKELVCKAVNERNALGLQAAGSMQQVAQEFAARSALE